ncbi:hypothetical protein HYT23_00060 [Candidatus Pacearchaeota archaeon]|nr:hypothetical protein [Candidatus Pacearchaeota archaeon]
MAQKLIRDEIMGKFFDLVISLGNESKDKKWLMGLLDEWWTATFKLDCLSAVTHRWRNTLTSDNFRNNMEIYQDGLLVYKANVHRYNHDIQSVEVYSRNDIWSSKVEKLVRDYY